MFWQSAIFSYAVKWQNMATGTPDMFLKEKNQQTAT
jgi:hypothetical protein